jgi:hypothetical protein
MLFSLPAFALLVAMLPSIPARADDAASLLAKHKAFVGFTFGDGKIASLSLTQTVTNDKSRKVVTSVHELDAGSVYRADSVDLARKETSYDGFTGNIFWYSNQNGFTVPIIGDPAKLGLAETLFFSDAVATLPWADQPSAQIDGKTYDVERVTQASAFPIDLYVDPATGAYQRAVIDPGGDQEETFDVLGYAVAAPGTKIVSKWKYKDSAFTHELTAIIANAPVTAAEFHPPAQTASWSFSNAGAFPIKITPSRFIISAKVNGVPGKFIFDTGSSGILLSDDFARHAHVIDLGSGEDSGVAGNLKTTTARVSTIDIGGNVLSNVIVSHGGTGIDLDAPDGLLGFDVLAGALVTLDIANSTMQLQDLSTDSSGIAGVRVAADLSQGTPVLPMLLDGVATINALVDSGDPATMLVPTSFIYDHHLRFLRNAAQEITGVGGGYEIDACGSLDSINLGPVAYVHAPICESDSFSGSDGLIGFDFIKGFDRVVFDYPHSMLVFVPAKQ